MTTNPAWATLERLVKRCHEQGYTIIEEDIGNEELQSITYEDGVLLLTGEARVFVPRDVTISLGIEGRVELRSESGITVCGEYSGCETFHEVTLSVWKRQLIDASELLG